MKKENMKKGTSKVANKDAVSSGAQSSANRVVEEPISAAGMSVSNDTIKPNGSSIDGPDNTEVIQKGKRRKHSLPNADIQIGKQMSSALQEDKEVE